MAFIPGPLRLRLPHHEAPAWPADLLSYEEIEWHLRQLKRTACGCFKYMGFNSRATITVRLPDGSTRQEKGARVMCLLREDRPLGPREYACHACDNAACMHPDHLYAGSHSTNVRDRSRPGRPIRERTAARWYDYDPQWVSQRTGTPTAVFEQLKSKMIVRVPYRGVIREDRTQAFLDH